MDKDVGDGPALLQKGLKTVCVACCRGTYSVSCRDGKSFGPSHGSPVMGAVGDGLCGVLCKFVLPFEKCR